MCLTCCWRRGRHRHAKAHMWRLGYNLQYLLHSFYLIWVLMIKLRLAGLGASTCLQTQPLHVLPLSCS